MLGALATYYSTSSNAFVRAILVAFSYLGLIDSWQTPVMSASVLRATIGKGLNRSDENAMLLSQYLESLGRGGRWYFGNILSLAYLATMVSWGVVAVDFPSLTGINDLLTFGLVDTVIVLFLWSVYRLGLMRFLRNARRAGFPVQPPRRAAT